MLVDRGIFKKIKVNFLLVGHTHDHIDQMFSRFSKKLARCDAFTLLMLSRLITEAYTPKPDIKHFDEVYDFKRCCVDGDGSRCRVLAMLNDISFNHVFLIQKVCLVTTRPCCMPNNTHLVCNGSQKRDVGSYCIFQMQ